MDSTQTVMESHYHQNQKNQHRKEFVDGCETGGRANNRLVRELSGFGAPFHAEGLRVSLQ